MKPPKKKYYEVTCQLDMCAECESKIVVHTTKPLLASAMAEHEFYRKGHFHVKVISCKEMQ